jgi:hypothetical protein
MQPLFSESALWRVRTECSQDDSETHASPAADVAAKRAWTTNRFGAEPTE